MLNSKSIFPKNLKANKKYAVNPEVLSDEDLISFLLFAKEYSKESKIKSAELIKNFGNIKRIFSADLIALSSSLKDAKAYFNYTLIKELNKRILKQEILNKDLINSWDQLILYLQKDIGSLTQEVLKIIYLDKKNFILADEIICLGTIDQVHFYPRELIKRILFHGASSIILVHNHPSNDPTPSKKDIKLTEKAIKICKNIDVKVYDHVIITSDGCFSLINHNATDKL